MIPAPTLRRLGRVGYADTWRRMQQFTAARDMQTADEIWLLEHPPVFTQGLNGKPEHLLNAGDIPIVHTDRGGQITYHGPGQLIAYLLIDLQRRRLGVRALVELMEQSTIALLAGYGIAASGSTKAPGVYVGAYKIASLGLRIRRGCSYHGLALNVDMELSPFTRINPCGQAGLAVTQLRDLGVHDTLPDISDTLLQLLLQRLETHS